MKTRVAGLVASAAALAMALAIVALPSAAQYENDGKAKAKGGKKGPTGPVTHKPIPRTPDGKPDLTGTWQSGGVSITGEDGAPPLHPLPPIDQHTIARQPLTYKPEFEAKRKGLTTLDDPTLYCLLPGVPRIQTNPMPLEILETPKEIAILYEAFRVWRRIPLNDKLEHPDDLTPTWMGDSVGRWEGDTLVVDVTNFNEDGWFGEEGYFHSDAMHVVERLWRDGANLVYQYTVDDPKVLTAPWIAPPRVVKPSNEPLEESPKCVETDAAKLVNNDHHGQR